MKSVFTIIDRKFAEEALALYHEESVGYSIEIYGIGTASSEMIEILGLGSPEKSIIIGLIEASIAKEFLKKLEKELQLLKRGIGISFIMPLSSINKSTLEFLKSKKEN